MIVANLSGGRDSTTMVVKTLESGKDIDKIIFCDTLYEFPQMYEYIDKLDSWLQRKFNKTIIRLKPSEDILHKWAFTYEIQKGENKGRFRGLPKAIGLDYCTRELKANVTRDYVKALSPNKFKNKILIGYTYNEVENGRISNLSYGISEYPLHEYRFNELECENFLKERGIANPLYKHFKRTGCYLCPKQSTQSLYNLYRFYKQEWAKCKDMEKLAKEINAVTQTFKPNKTLDEYEKDFKKLEATPSLTINIEYEEEAVCFCK